MWHRIEPTGPCRCGASLLVAWASQAPPPNRRDRAKWSEAKAFGPSDRPTQEAGGGGGVRECGRVGPLHYPPKRPPLASRLGTVRRRLSLIASGSRSLSLLLTNSNWRAIQSACGVHWPAAAAAERARETGSLEQAHAPRHNCSPPTWRPLSSSLSLAVRLSRWPAP